MNVGGDATRCESTTKRTHVGKPDASACGGTSRTTVTPRCEGTRSLRAASSLGRDAGRERLRRGRDGDARRGVMALYIGMCVRRWRRCEAPSNTHTSVMIAPGRYYGVMSRAIDTASLATHLGDDRARRRPREDLEIASRVSTKPAARRSATVSDCLVVVTRPSEILKRDAISRI